MESYTVKSTKWAKTVNKLRTKTLDNLNSMSNNVLESILSLPSPSILSGYADSSYRNDAGQPIGTYTVKDDSSLLSTQYKTMTGITGSNFSKISNAYNYERAKNDINRDISAIHTGTDYNESIKLWMEESGYIFNKQRSIKYARDYFFLTRPYLEADNNGPYRSFAFLTRPNLNLVTKSNDRYLPCAELVHYPELMSLVTSDLELYSELCRDNCNKSNLWMLASNYISDVASPSFASTDEEGIRNAFGIEQKFPGIPDYHNVNISVNFMDNSRSDIAKLFNCIDRYKYAINKEGYPMRDEYIKYRSIDYLMSMYIIVVDANWEIVSFSTCITMTPGAGPTKFVVHKMDGVTKDDGPGSNFDIDFNCMTYRPHNPLYFDTFNLLSGFNPYDIIDTRGSGATLQVQGRAASRTSSSNKGTSVWSQVVSDNNYGYAISTNPNITTRIGDTRNYAYRHYKGIYEMIAPKPGIYLAKRTSERGRPVFKLGFSY
jgi:hypothetical protein